MPRLEINPNMALYFNTGKLPVKALSDFIAILLQ